MQLKKRDKFYTPEMIDDSLGNNELVPKYARVSLAKSLSLLPEEVIDFICENYVFISHDEDDNGSHWTFNDVYFKDKLGFIWLNSSLWREKPIQTAFTIAHEVAHDFLKHHTKDYSDTNSKKRMRQEKEADRLAVEWLNKRYQKISLMKLYKSNALRNRSKPPLASSFYVQIPRFAG